MMLRLNKKTDADIIAAIGDENPQQELRRLIRLAINMGK
jgi:hypothetical protein